MALQIQNAQSKKNGWAFVDLTNKRFASLVVLRELENRDKWGDREWECQCDCGKIFTAFGSNLKRGFTKSCGCKSPLYKLRMKAQTGTDVGRLERERETWYGIKARCYNKNDSDYKNYGGRGITVCDRWLECFENFFADMGKRPSRFYSLERVDNNGNYCPENCIWVTRKEKNLNKRKNKKISDTTETPRQAVDIRIGKYYSPEHRVWANMIQRCTNKKVRNYKDYGGRGIKVCERWRVFDNFLLDMELRPTPQHTLERINNDWDYCPENCKWATRLEQGSNRRGNVYYEFDGEIKIQSEWARHFSIAPQTLWMRLQRCDNSMYEVVKRYEDNYQFKTKTS